MLIELAIGAGASLLYSGNKSLKMDAEATAKYGKAFTRECEAQLLIKQKREFADMRLENVAKKKKAIISTSLPMFVDTYGHIQKINIQHKDRKFDLVEFSDADKLYMLQTVDIITKKDFTSKELIVGTMFKGISGMIVEDSKRNLSAARSQLSASNVIYSQAQSLAEVYDAIIGRADRISKLLVSMNSLFLGVISETQKIIDANGIDVRKYSEKEKSTIVLCVNFAIAITKILDIPVFDENGELAYAAIEMIQTGEDYLSKINELINEE